MTEDVSDDFAERGRRSGRVGFGASRLSKDEARQNRVGLTEKLVQRRQTRAHALRQSATDRRVAVTAE